MLPETNNAIIDGSINAKPTVITNSDVAENDREKILILMESDQNKVAHISASTSNASDWYKVLNNSILIDNSSSETIFSKISQEIQVQKVIIANKDIYSSFEVGKEINANQNALDSLANGFKYFGKH